MHHVSLDVDEGDIFGVIGQSGAGKSTLIRCLASLEKPNAGQIIFEGQDVVHMSRAELALYRQKIGMIFQHFNLFSSRDVAGNIAYPLEVHGMAPNAREERIEEALALVGLEGKRNAYPAQLSGGQKQRVGIARALATHPHVLFCDEATSALDPKTTKDILHLLKRLNKTLNLTIVLITHEMEVVKQICNKVAVMDKGRIVECGSIGSIFTDPEHPMTQSLLQNALHEVPASLFKDISATRRLLRMSFKGKGATQPIISKMIRQYDVEVNILLGWIDSLQGAHIGHLVIDIRGPEHNIDEAFLFLQKMGVHYEEVRS